MGMTEQCLVRAELVGLDWPLGVQKKAPIASQFEASLRSLETCRRKLREGSLRFDYEYIYINRD